jgi:hypothetical protein
VKVRCILIGGFAVNAYEYGRDTQDIDFLIQESDLEKITKELLSAGFSEKQKMDLFSRFQHPSAKSFPVDFLSIDTDTFKTIFDAGHKITVAGRTFIIPSLNHLIALKLHALKQGQEHRYHKDMLDILELIRLHKIDIYSAEFKELCLKYASEAIYKKIKLLFE